MIKFRVATSWVTSNNIDVDTISLYRWNDDKWNKLTTTKKTQETDYITFEATTPGFSYFAITGQIIELEEEEEEEEEEEVVDEGWGAREWGILILALLIVGGGYYYYNYMNKKKTPWKDLSKKYK